MTSRTRGEGAEWLDEAFAPSDRELARELGRAIGRGDLELVFQPIFDLAGGTMVGAETLVRWRHPSRGFQRPEELLPLAERAGLILPLGEWLLAQACERLAFWQRTAAVGSGFWLSVDLTPRQIEDAGLASRLAGWLGESGLRSGSLVLELTEPWPARRPGMVSLHDLGIRLTVDEGCDGGAPLATLRELAPELVKLDSSFVRGLARSDVDVKLMHSLLLLAHAFDSVVVADGVETRAQLDCLRRLGCPLAQGFFLSPPLGEAELLALAVTVVAA